MPADPAASPTFADPAGSPTLADPAASPTLAALARQSSAEEIFALLGLDPDPAVLNVARLHILRRFGAALAECDFDGLDEAAIAARCRAALAQAHDAFIAATPRQAGLFRVFAARPDRPRGSFVSLDALRPGQG